MSNPEIDRWYELAMSNGAVGGKLIGAGGGGFLLFYTEDKKRLRHAMREAGLEEVRLAVRLRRHQDARAMTRDAYPCVVGRRACDQASTSARCKSPRP